MIFGMTHIYIFLKLRAFCIYSQQQRKRFANQLDKLFTSAELEMEIFGNIFQFLQIDLIGYLQDWLNSIQNRPGFTKEEKNRMFLSHQTYKGLLTSGTVKQLNFFLV